MAQSLDQLIAARAVQALGGGALVPVATAAASHLFEGHDRPRALGVIGALTFLGMAAGPVPGGAPSWTRSGRRPPSPGWDSSARRPPTSSHPAWRYVFYVNVPIGIAALVVGWAATAGWDTPRSDGTRRRRSGRSSSRVALGRDPPRRHAPRRAGRRGRRLGPGPRGRLGRCWSASGSPRASPRSCAACAAPIRSSTRACSPTASSRSAALVSLLTGYAFATAIVGLGRLRGPCPVRRPGRPAARARAPWPGATAVGALRLRAGWSGTGRCACVTAAGPGRLDRRARLDGDLDAQAWTTRRSPPPAASSASASA